LITGRSKSASFCPSSYVHGLDQGDFELALRGLLGDGAPLSASSIEPMRAGCQQETVRLHCDKRRRIFEAMV
jgi:hypothetical protein